MFAKIADLYRPMVSQTMSARFQMGEVVLPIIFSLLLAAIGSFPWFYVGRWGVGIMATLISALLFYTLRAVKLRLSSEQQSNGERYLSPSVASSAEMVAGGCSIGLVFLLILFNNWLSGANFK